MVLTYTIEALLTFLKPLVEDRKGTDYTNLCVNIPIPLHVLQYCAYKLAGLSLIIMYRLNRNITKFLSNCSGIHNISYLQKDTSQLTPLNVPLAIQNPPVMITP